ncbi:MAG: nucleotidyltransferase family protein [Anaerolineales bacterium]|nr:nucleotidyltransferase family protein [Anaerolineales bacterium]
MISAIILAAGKSARMGQNKMMMKWGDMTVIEKVIQTIQDSRIEDIVLVTNPDLQIPIYNVRITINETNHEMLSSLQLGLQVLAPSAFGTSPKYANENIKKSANQLSVFGGGRVGVEATIICLGDQPQIESRSVRAVCEAYQKSKSNLVVPSYQNRRGHPWLVAKPLWDEIFKMKENQTPRDFLNAHANEIEYVSLDTPTILQDLDTPEDYLKYKPNV